MAEVIGSIVTEPERETKSNRRQVEVAISANSIKHFAKNHVWIQNNNTGNIEKWLPWDYLLDLIDIIQKYDVTYILKASQNGISWLIAIINLHLTLFNDTAKCLLLSQGQTEAKELLGKVGFIYDHLPDYMKIPMVRDSRISMSFKNDYTEIIALPSTEKAGHGFQGTMVCRDEVARHEYARENFKAVARAGGKLVELSTANKNEPNNYFDEKTRTIYYDPNTVKKVLESGIELYTNKNIPDTCLVFLKWQLRPQRKQGLSNEDWWARDVVPRFTPLEIEEQFPSEITDVFKPSLTEGYFEFKALDEMGFDTCNPIKQDTIDTMNGIVRVYKPPMPGRRYVLFTDPSNGVGDPFVTGVMDYITGEVVCSATGMEKIGIVAKLHDSLVRNYNNATNSYEYNSVGMAMAERLEDMKTPNQAPRRKVDGKIDIEKKGQHVSGQSKELILGELAGAISHRRFVIHDREFLQQAKLVTRNGDKPETDKKLPFDWVMMMGGLWQLQKYVPRGEASIQTFDQTREGKWKLAS